MASTQLVVIALALFVASGSAVPPPAAVGQTSFCSIHWIFAQSCGVIMTPLSDAIQSWMAVNQCGSSPAGEDCEYISQDYEQEYSIRGVVMTFPSGFVSEFGFVVYDGGENVGGTCNIRAKGLTTKDVVTDPDFNYCSLMWILEESKLTTLYGNSKSTDVDMCPEMKAAFCEDNLPLLSEEQDLMHNY